MLCHLVFPYEWVECSDKDSCEKAAHLNDSPELLNSYPHEWLIQLLGCSLLDETQVAWVDSNRKFHRDDGPALEKASGHMLWFQHGKKHRLDGPAEYNNGGGSYWFSHGMSKLRNEVGLKVKSEEWWVDGKRHRVDGPALLWENGSEMWWMNDGLHRYDGPAVTKVDGEQEWWIEGIQYTYEMFCYYD